MLKIYRAVIASVAVLAATASLDPAQAQHSQELCHGISGCSTEILSGTLSNGDLAVAYNNRGFAYRAKGQHDRATYWRNS